MMDDNKNLLEVELRFFQPAGQEPGASNISEVLDCVVNHLREALGVTGLAVVGEAETGTLYLSMVVSSGSGEIVETTINKAIGSLRTAVHACGVRTPGAWHLPDYEFGSVNLTPAVTAPTTVRTSSGDLALT